MKDEEIKLELTMADFKKAEAVADKIMKESNGHAFETILKTRCQFCGSSPKAKGRCGQWFQSFLYFLDYVLINKKWSEI